MPDSRAPTPSGLTRELPERAYDLTHARHVRVPVPGSPSLLDELNEAARRGEAATLIDTVRSMTPDEREVLSRLLRPGPSPVLWLPRPGGGFLAPTHSYNEMKG